MLRKAETYGMRHKERRAIDKRWRKERRRSVPSPPAVFQYLARFHDRREEVKRLPHRAFIPAANEALAGLGKVNDDLVAQARGSWPWLIAHRDQCEIQMLHSSVEVTQRGCQGQPRLPSGENAMT